MVKAFKYGFLILLITFFNRQANAQNSIGVGLTFGSEIENVGFTVNGEIFVMDELAIAPDFIYYLGKTNTLVLLGTTTELKQTLWELNANIHYFFLQGPVDVYGLTGLNYSNVAAEASIQVPGFPPSTSDTSNGDIGINLGGGANFKLKANITPFAELKFVVISTDQLVLSGGVRIGLL